MKHCYFFIYPLGHAGDELVTFLVVLPLRQIIVFTPFFEEEVAMLEFDIPAWDWTLLMLFIWACISGNSLILIVGDEKVKFPGL